MNSMRRVCALSLPGVRMAAALFKNGSRHVAHNGKDRGKCHLQRRMHSCALKSQQ